MDAKVIGNVMSVLEAALNRGETLIAESGDRSSIAASPVATGDTFNCASTAAVNAARRIGMAPPAKCPSKPRADTTGRVGVLPPAAAAPEPPPADHELGPGHALSAPPWYRRPGIPIAAAFAALIAGVGIIVSGPGEPGTAPGDTTGTSTPWSASFSLIATGWFTPDPTAPPEAEPPTAEQATPPPSAAPPHTAAPPPPQPPPPPPPSELVFRHEPLTAVVSITNNANKPAVGCVYRSVAVTGPAAAVHYDHSVNFTVTGSAETRVHVGDGPATGSTFHATVSCDNGLSTSQDVIY